MRLCVVTWACFMLARSMGVPETLKACVQLGFLDTLESEASMMTRVSMAAEKGRGPVFYVHIAKCAGTSVAEHLSQLLDHPKRRLSTSPEEIDVDRQVRARAEKEQNRRQGHRKRRTREALKHFTTGSSRRLPIKFFWKRGIEPLTLPEASFVLRSDIVSIERDATWRGPGGNQAPRARFIMLRSPTCRALSHFEQHRNRGRLARGQIFDDYLRACCLGGTEPTTRRDACAVECRSFFNFETFMLVGRSTTTGTAVGPERAATWTQLTQDSSPEERRCHTKEEERVARTTVAVNAAVKSLSTMDFIGLVEHMQLSLCLLYYTLGLARLLQETCSKYGQGGQGLRRANANRNEWKSAIPDQEIGHGAWNTTSPHCRKIPRCTRNSSLVAAANLLDEQVYSTGCEIFFRRVADMQRETGLEFSGIATAPGVG